MTDYTQRAAAVAEHDTLAARIDHSVGRAVLPEDAAARPYALRWRALLADGSLVSLETFDAAEDCITVGAHAIVDRRDPVVLRAECREVTHETGAGWRSETEREADHRAAALRLCEANGWEGATVERAGERWEP